MLRARMDGEETLGRLAREMYDLPLRAEPARQAVERNVVDQQREQLLVELVRELVFVGAPFQREPMLRDEEQDRLAARGRILERPRPALTAGDPRSGSKSRKMSSSPLQPSRIIQACNAIAQSSFCSND